MSVPRIKKSSQGFVQPESYASSEERQSLHGIRVLYAEDTPLCQFVMERICEKFQWDLTITTTGQQSLKLALNENYDVVLMDIQLGPESDFDGYETARRIKKVKPHLVILSYSSDPMNGRDELGPEMDGHIKKPTPTDNLFKVIKSFLKPKSGRKDGNTE